MGYGGSKAGTGVRIAAVVAAALLSVGSAETALAARVPVVTCGQVVSGYGVLTGNLDCSGFSGPAVTLADKARFDLDHFTLSGGDGDGVLCQGYCRVSSSDTAVGGTISGFSGDGIVARSVGGSVAGIRVLHLSIHDNGANAARVDAADGNVTVSKSSVENNGAAGVVSPRRIRASRSTISGNALEGLRGESVSVLDSTVSGNGTGVDGSSYMNLQRSDILQNTGDGLHVGATLQIYFAHIQNNAGSGIVFSEVRGEAHIQFAEISDNGVDGIRVDGPQIDRLRTEVTFVRRNGRYGIVAKRLLVHECRIDDNAIDGVFMPADGDPCILNIDQYSLAGNGTDASCGVSVHCADIASCEAPANITAHTVCGTSYDTTSGFPGASWGVCNDD